MREELAALEGQEVVVRGTLKQVSHLYTEGPYNLLFVNCVFKPLGDPALPLAEVEAGRTDHAWVQVPDAELAKWRRENPTSLLLKKYENVFKVKRYRRLDGSEDFGFCLPDEEWFLVARLITALNHVKAERKGKDPVTTFKILQGFRDKWGDRNLFTSIDSKVSIERALLTWVEKYDIYCQETYLKAMAGHKPKKKKQQKQGPKPGRGF